MTTKQINALKRENQRLKKHNQGLKEGAKNESQVDMAEAFKKNLKKSATPSELKLIKLLTEAGVNFEFQKVIYVNPKFIILDFYLPKAKVIIELDGGQHFKDDTLAIDKNRDSYLKKQGLKVLRLSNNKANDLNITSLKNILKDFKNNTMYKKVKEYKDYEIITFGKYQGKTIKDIYLCDKSYLVWLYRSLLATYSEDIMSKLKL